MGIPPGPPQRPETAPVTRGDVQWVGFVTSTTAFVTWLVGQALGGPVPPEVYAFVQYAVPVVMAGLAGEWRWRMARRRAK